MTFDTRLFFLIKKCVFKLKQKIYIFKKSFATSLFILLAGFLLGNVFGTFLNILRFFIPWDGFIILLILLILEGISYLTYYRCSSKHQKQIVDLSVMSGNTGKSKKYNFYTLFAPFALTPSTQAKVPMAIQAREERKKPNFISQTSTNQTDQKYFWTLSKQEIQTYKDLNFLKIGLMFGFFIDAFKVGS